MVVSAPCAHFKLEPIHKGERGKNVERKQDQSRRIMRQPAQLHADAEAEDTPEWIVALECRVLPTHTLQLRHQTLCVLWHRAKGRLLIQSNLLRVDFFVNIFYF